MSRVAKISTVSFQVSDRPESKDVIIQRGLDYIAEAAKMKPDLIVFPEEFEYYGLSEEDRQKTGEKIPGGPVMDVFLKAAKKYDTNLVIGLRELDDGVKYNTGVVFDRKGNYKGKYRKTHLAPGECDEITPGNEYPVFELDFGTIGITICMEIHYQEIFTIMALQGADIIVHPTMWLDYNGILNESLVNARAIDNQIYMVTSHFVRMPYLSGRPMGHARIVDPGGRTRADTGHRPGIAFAQIDLDEGFEYWATGELKEQYPTLKECFLGMRRPETYKIITRTDSENSWRIKNKTLYGG